MSDDVTVEAVGETVGEAKWQAVRELERLAPGLDRERVRFQVMSEGERGLLGVGYTPARVLASVERTASAAAADPVPGEAAEFARVRELLERTARGLGVSCSIRIDERDDEIVATLSGPDLGILIGRRGQTIDALQYLANAIGHRDLGTERRHVTVDAAGYRSRRTAMLEQLAQQCAHRAAATGRAVELDPMTAVERKIVHEFLKEDPEVETASEGTEPNRFVVVFPRRSID